MKIVYCKESLGTGAGMERVLCTKVNYLTDVLGHEVYIALASPMPQDLFFAFSPRVIIRSLEIKTPVKKLQSLFFKTKYYREYEQKLSAFLQEIRPDITISMFGREAKFLYKIADGSVKVLEFHFTKNYLIHLGKALPNDKFRCLRKYWLYFLKNREENMAGKYAHIVLLTQKDKELWGNRPEFEVISNPLSFETEETADLENKIILSMGRLVYPKGFQYLIRAFALLKEEYSDWRVNIYGNGHDKELLQNEIDALSLQQNVFLEEPVPEVKSVMMKSSILVLPSLYEGFGLVLTEAMTCGVPCVAFDCECGPSDIIEDKADGFLVPLGNIQALAEKMKLLMSDKELRVKMGHLAAKNVRRFDVSIVMNRWEKYLNEINK